MLIRDRFRGNEVLLEEDCYTFQFGLKGFRLGSFLEGKQQLPAGTRLDSTRLDEEKEHVGPIA